MKAKKDIMYVKEKCNRFGELSFELHCSGKDPLTRKNKVFVRTYKVPPELTGVKEIEAFRLKIQLEFKEEVQKQAYSLSPKKTNILLVDFAEEYVENIIKRDPQAYNHYKTCKGHLQTVKSKLGTYFLTELTPPLIQRFCLWLCERTYTKVTVVAKAGLRELIRERRLTLVCVARACNIAPNTLGLALNEGKHISKKTAKKICAHLNFPMEKFFTVTKEERHYAQSVNNAVKVFLHGVLQEAVRQGLIEHNYASKDYTRPVTGTKKEKEILASKEEIDEYIRCMHSEPSIRKRVVFACYLYLGLRNAEVAGLAWINIDLEAERISIVQNTMYVPGFGTITKDPKSEKSKRDLAIPRTLVEILSSYKIYWEAEKARHGDLWAATDRLFCTNKGKEMNGSTLANWLKEWQIKNGLKLVTPPHGIRHSSVSVLIANGVDVKTVAARVGHADIQTTLNIYAHCMQEADRKAADKIDDLFCI